MAEVSEVKWCRDYLGAPPNIPDDEVMSAMEGTLALQSHRVSVAWEAVKLEVLGEFRKIFR